MRACGPFFVPRNGMYIVHVRAKSIYDGRMCEKKSRDENEGANEEWNPFSERMRLQAVPKRRK